jgi:hypothetical protein
MRDLAQAALTIVERREESVALNREDRSQMREMASEARSVLADAGYPGEASWRAIQRASIGLDTAFDEPDRSYWQDLGEELRSAISALDNLVGVSKREADVRIVG